ncbi:MAG: hypothetical protein AB7J13_00785 [Pyrinomonadaceae bacterium]
MNVNEKKQLRIHLSPLFLSAGAGIFFAVLAVFLQDGDSRGYASSGLLFLMFGLAALLVLMTIVTLAFARIQAALAMLGSALILLTTYIVVVLALGSLIGE